MVLVRGRRKSFWYDPALVDTFPALVPLRTATPLQRTSGAPLLFLPLVPLPLADSPFLVPKPLLRVVIAAPMLRKPRPRGAQALIRDRQHHAKISVRDVRLPLGGPLALALGPWRRFFFHWFYHRRRRRRGERLHFVLLENRLELSTIQSFWKVLLHSFHQFLLFLLLFHDLLCDVRRNLLHYRHRRLDPPKLLFLLRQEGAHSDILRVLLGRPPLQMGLLEIMLCSRERRFFLQMFSQLLLLFSPKLLPPHRQNLLLSRVFGDRVGGVHLQRFQS